MIIAEALVGFFCMFVFVVLLIVWLVQVLVKDLLTDVLLLSCRKVWKL